MIHGLLTAAAITGFICLPLWLMARRDARAAAQRRHPSSAITRELFDANSEAIDVTRDGVVLMGEIESFLIGRQPPR